MSNAIRLEIVHTLRQGPKLVKEIAQATGRPRSEISCHLGALRNGDILTAQRSGQENIYRIANPKIVNICYLMREVLAEEASRLSNLMRGFSNEHSG
jgi:DNA-binding transcriptional ArsR family regulator